MYHMIVKLFQDSDRVENKIFGGEESSNWETGIKKLRDKCFRSLRGYWNYHTV